VASGHRGGVVVGLVIHNDELAHERFVFAHGVNHRPNGGGFVFGGDDDVSADPALDEVGSTPFKICR